MIEAVWDLTFLRIAVASTAQKYAMVMLRMPASATCWHTHTNTCSSTNSDSSSILVSNRFFASRFWAKMSWWVFQLIDKSKSFEETRGAIRSACTRRRGYQIGEKLMKLNQGEQLWRDWHAHHTGGGELRSTVAGYYSECTLRWVRQLATTRSPCTSALVDQNNIATDRHDVFSGSCETVRRASPSTLPRGAPATRKRLVPLTLGAIGYIRTCGGAHALFYRTNEMPAASNSVLVQGGDGEEANETPTKKKRLVRTRSLLLRCADPPSPLWS